ncbi:Cytochrome P450 oxidoreductase [Penicillium crustosum]|uniref:Cytochrome P450 oxidoreductase n=1 Tax=Penicillium crustosum TaxID=36656 RepID=UPI0023835873|nr:Cytochrome P450 oxidoreductase [Penicillium crustosum]KAJ5393900.1 Cytochrome P450 oxidoreductase [Penicillium crustosum]
MGMCALRRAGLMGTGLTKSLLEKKSNTYSHRPTSLVSHLITQSEHLLAMKCICSDGAYYVNNTSMLHGTSLRA